MASILLMEDDPEQAELFASLLETDGHDVIQAHSATAAWDICESHQAGFEVVITDMLVRRDGIPVPDGGTKLINKLRMTDPRTLPWLAKIKIIAVTGVYLDDARPDLLTIAGTLGADAVMQKPVDFDELLAKIRELTAA